MKINQQKIILVIIITLIIIAGAIWFFVFMNQEKVDDTQANQQNLFPFGQVTPGTGFGDGNNQGTIGEDGQIIDNQDTVDESVPEDNSPQLRLISNEPTGGFIPLIRVEEEQVVTDQISQEGIVSQNIETIEVENQFVRYSTIEDGSVYETRLSGDIPFTRELIVENFIPNAEHSVFSKTGEAVSFQYWDNDNRNIETYLAKIDPLSLDIDLCPYDFSGPVDLGTENESVYDIHRFLNRDPRTQIASAGVNSPGNEATLSTEATISAIEKFQSLYQLKVDGSLGPQTRGEMLRVCNEQQEEIAQAKLNDLDTKYEISGFFLPQNIISINMSPQGDEVFYLEKENSGVAGTLRKLSDQTRRTIFSSPYSDWTSSWAKNDTIELTTKPSYAARGYSYELEAENGDFHKSFKQKKGLMALPSNNGERILVHDVDSGRSRLSIYERSTNRFLPLSIETFTDKCTWSANDDFIYCAVPDALAYGVEYPDTWYQGLETYRDSLWRINTQSLQEEVLSNVSAEYGQEIDVEKILVDENNQYLYFIDKNTENLWSYRIDEV